MKKYVNFMIRLIFRYPIHRILSDIVLGIVNENESMTSVGNMLQISVPFVSK